MDILLNKDCLSGDKPTRLKATYVGFLSLSKVIFNAKSYVLEGISKSSKDYKKGGTTTLLLGDEEDEVRSKSLRKEISATAETNVAVTMIIWCVLF